MTSPYTPAPRPLRRMRSYAALYGQRPAWRWLIGSAGVRYIATRYSIVREDLFERAPVVNHVSEPDDPCLAHEFYRLLDYRGYHDQLSTLVHRNRDTGDVYTTPLGQPWVALGHAGAAWDELAKTGAVPFLVVVRNNARIYWHDADGLAAITLPKLMPWAIELGAELVQDSLED